MRQREELEFRTCAAVFLRSLKEVGIQRRFLWRAFFIYSVQKAATVMATDAAAETKLQRPRYFGNTEVR